MRFWAVTHKHTAYVQADNEAEACETVADSVRENAVANDCTAEEIGEREFEQHWLLIENSSSASLHRTEPAAGSGTVRGVVGLSGKEQ